MTLRPPTVLTRTVRYAHDGGRLLEHLAAAGLIATTTDDGPGARPLDTVLLESVDIATKVSRTTIAVLEACARLTCQGPTVTVEALPQAPADGRAALARLREALADYQVLQQFISEGLWDEARRNPPSCWAHAQQPTC